MMPPGRLCKSQARAGAPWAVAQRGCKGERFTLILNVIENAAVHAARPIAGGRGKDTGINKMFKAQGGGASQWKVLHEGWCHCCDALRGVGWGAYSPAVAQKATGFGDPKNEPSIINGKKGERKERGQIYLFGFFTGTSNPNKSVPLLRSYPFRRR